MFLVPAAHLEPIGAFDNVAVGHDIAVGKHHPAPHALGLSFGVDVFHNHRAPGSQLVNFASGLGVAGSRHPKEGEEDGQRGVSKRGAHWLILP